MHTLILVPSGVTFAKSYPINTCSSFTNDLPNRPLTNKKSTAFGFPNEPTFQFQKSSTKINTSSKLISFPCFGFQLKPKSQIHDLGEKIVAFNDFVETPFDINNFCAKPRSRIAKAATSDVQSGGDEGGKIVVNPKSKTLQLGLIFGFWYFQNIVFNIYNKKVLNLFPFPWLLASFQLFVGSVWMLILWSFKLQPCPKITKPFIIALLGPALFHTIGHISACVSFSKVAVSFTHVIKSSEPVFAVVFSSILGETYALNVWLSILPIVLGCSIAAMTEVSFNFGGLSGAMISNVGFVLRNIYSKRSLQSFKEVNGLNLYGWISILSFLYLFPVAIFVEGSQWVPGYHKAIRAVGKSSTLYLWVMLSGVFYHLYNQSSYEALDEISPLTFSVGNTMKRVVVIASSILVFRNPVMPLNAIGSAIAIFGTFLYSLATSANKAKKIQEKKKSQ